MYARSHLHGLRCRPVCFTRPSRALRSLVIYGTPNEAAGRPPLRWTHRMRRVDFRNLWGVVRLSKLLPGVAHGSSVPCNRCECLPPHNRVMRSREHNLVCVAVSVRAFVRPLPPRCVWSLYSLLGYTRLHTDYLSTCVALVRGRGLAPEGPWCAHLP